MSCAQSHFFLPNAKQKAGYLIIQCSQFCEHKAKRMTVTSVTITYNKLHTFHLWEQFPPYSRFLSLLRLWDSLLWFGPFARSFRGHKANIIVKY